MLRSPRVGSHAQSAILPRPLPEGGGAAVERGDAGCRTLEAGRRLSEQSGAAKYVGVDAAALQQGYGDGREPRRAVAIGCPACAGQARRAGNMVRIIPKGGVRCSIDPADKTGKWGAERGNRAAGRATDVSAKAF
jgi:hypothetical protein